MKKAFAIILILILNLIHYNSIAQEKKLDSLKLAYKQAKHDSTRCNVLLTLGEELSLENPDTAVFLWEKSKSLSSSNIEKINDGAIKNRFLNFYATSLSNLASIIIDQGQVTLSLKYCKDALKIFEEIKDKSGMAAALSNMGYIYAQQADVTKALDCFKQALKLQEELKDKNGIGNELYNIGAVYRNQGDIKNALDCFYKSLKIMESINNRQGMAAALNDIAMAFIDQGDLEKALGYMNKILAMYENVNDKQGIAETLNNLGFIYDKQGNYDKALEYHYKSLKVREETNDKRGVSVSYGNIAYVLENKGDFPKAFSYYNLCINIQEELNDLYGLSVTLNNVSQFLINNGKQAEALRYAKRGFETAKQLGYPKDIRNAAGTLKSIYQKQNKHKEALEMYELVVKMHDSVNNEEVRKASLKMEFRIEYEIEAAKDSLANIVKLNQEQMKHEQAITRQRIYTYGGAIGFTLMLVVAVVSFKAFKNKQKANVIITEQKAIAENQKHIIEEKQKEIIDSINYAQRIQRAILASEEDIKIHFPESYLLYQPKDIVAGDFYFFETTSKYAFYAAADCTGHGVPGALVSVVCANALTRCVKEFELTDPGKILDQARELVLDTFKKSGQDVKDGMDISILVKEIDTNKYYWAGANNPLWYIQNNVMNEVTANKQPIGLSENPKPFTTHELNVLKGDTLFLFTDGYADQFGGPKGKKFKYKQLSELLLANINQPIAEQKELLLNTFNNWKDNLEQVDDVCVIGIKV